MNAQQVRDWLKAHGHKAAKVNALKLGDVAQGQRALRELHVPRAKPKKVEG